MNPPHDDLVLSWVSIRASPNPDILGMKFDSKLTFEDHVRYIVSHISHRIGSLRLVKLVFVDTSVLFHCHCAFALVILEYIGLRCWGQLLNVTFSFPSARCLRWPSFVQIKVSCCCVIDVMFLDCVCCPSLIRNRSSVCSVSSYLLMPEFGIFELRLQLNH